MGMFKRIKDAFEKPALAMYEGLLNELCDRLRQIGVNGTAHLSGSMMESMRSSLVGAVAGYVKIEGRNIDIVQVEIEQAADDRPYMRSYYHYLVLANVEGLEKRLEAKVKPDRKGFLGREIVSYRWEGGELAQRLNDDPELRSMLPREWSNQSPDIEVRAHVKPRRIPMIGKPPQEFLDAQAAFNPCVRITNTRANLPTREAFEIYDRIAQNIHSAIASRSK